MPIDPIGLALLAYTGFVVIAYIVITILEIFDWFKQRTHLSEQNENLIGFTLAEKLRDREYTTIDGVFGKSAAKNKMIQGIFDKATNEIVDARKVLGRRVDDEVVAQHAKGGLVIYT